MRSLTIAKVINHLECFVLENFFGEFTLSLRDVPLRVLTCVLGSKSGLLINSLEMQALLSRKIVNYNPAQSVAKQNSNSIANTTPTLRFA